MSRTRRKKWVTDPTNFERTIETIVPENTCKPGCWICGKKQKREERRRTRHEKIDPETS